MRWPYLSYFHFAGRLHAPYYACISRHVMALRIVTFINEIAMKHFTLSEFTRSDAAQRNGIENVPSKAQAQNLECLCALILDPLRECIGHPIYITSGFRSKRLNRIVGGSATSAHMEGLASDFRVGDKDYLLDWAWCLLKSPSKEFRAKIDQCIYYREKHFIHVSLPKDGKARHQFWIE